MGSFFFFWPSLPLHGDFINLPNINIGSIDSFLLVGMPASDLFKEQIYSICNYNEHQLGDYLRVL